jgi:hypothetical protein
MSRLKDRLSKLEGALSGGGDHGKLPQLIIVRGGLPDGPLHATADGRTIAGEPGEVLANFTLRAQRFAASLGCKHVVVGGLPRLPEETTDPPTVAAVPNAGAKTSTRTTQMLRDTPDAQRRTKWTA